MKSSKVQDIMSRNVVTIQKTTPFLEACRYFQEFNIHHLPVVDDHHNIIGMFTASDALDAFTSRVGSLDDYSQKTIDEALKVEEMMNNYKVYTIESDASANDAAAIMHSNNVHSILILEDTKINGIVTNTDLTNYYRSE